MPNLNEAKKIVLENIPDGDIQGSIEYNNLYVFMVFTPDEEEGQFDPFYSVNKETGEFSDFSVITDGDTGEIFKRFAASKSKKSEKSENRSETLASG